MLLPKSKVFKKLNRDLNVINNFIAQNKIFILLLNELNLWAQNNMFAACLHKADYFSISNCLIDVVPDKKSS